MFFRQSKFLKFLTILTVCVMSVSLMFSTALAKNSPRNLDNVDNELHPWGGDDNFNPDDVTGEPDLAPPIIVSPGKKGMIVGIWNFVVFKVESMYMHFTRSRVTTTTAVPTTDTNNQNGGQ